MSFLPLKFMGKKLKNSVQVTYMQVTQQKKKREKEKSSARSLYLKALPHFLSWETVK